MAKKKSSWGQQEYVPAGNGDASGEYADESGSNRNFQSFEKPDKETSANDNAIDATEPEKKEKPIPENYDTWLNETRQEKLKKERYETLAMSSKDSPIKKINDNLIDKALKEGHSKEIVSKATDIIRKYEGVVDNIANDLEGLAAQGNGVMVGLGFRLKSLTSLSRKINSELIDMKKEGVKNPTIDEAISNMKDIARFTMVFDGDNFEKNVESTINKLKEQGYTFVRGKNTFKEGAPYKGLNCNFLDKNGNIFELQFHIPDSIKVKEGIDVDLANKKATIDNHSLTSHDYYETNRLIEDKIKNGTVKHNEQELYNRLTKEAKDRWTPVRNYEFAFLK